jgi:hypothetical protein
MATPYELLPLMGCVLLANTLVQVVAVLQRTLQEAGQASGKEL